MFIYILPGVLFKPAKESLLFKRKVVTSHKVKEEGAELTSIVLL